LIPTNKENAVSESETMSGVDDKEKIINRAAKHNIPPSEKCPTCSAEIDGLGRALPPPQPDGFRNPALTVDAACTRESESGTEVLLITRGRSPFKGQLGLPGGFVDYGEDPQIAVLRELQEETGVGGIVTGLLDVRGDPTRDPRKHNVTIVYWVEADDSEPIAGDDAANAAWYNLDDVISGNCGVTSFDHLDVLIKIKESL
jgi:8-oxo-dGTP diphosphatase